MFSMFQKMRSMAYRSGLYEAIHQITAVQTECPGTAVGHLCVATPPSEASVLYRIDPWKGSPLL